MEPTLCFVLCETPIIYIQHEICRCSGGGLLDHNRQRDEYCTIPCRKPDYHEVKTVNTCGGRGTYSAYTEENFYTQHAHLFNFRIQFASCELWNASGYYDIMQVKIDASSVKYPLNKLERCAATCLDQNAMIKSIAFNSDSNQCLCIIPRESFPDFGRAFYLTVLPSYSCDHYCDNTLDDSKVKHKFKCGSLTDSRIWAIYDLNGICAIDSFYIKELKKCISTRYSLARSCPFSSMEFVYHENLSWNIFLKIIEKLNLTKSIVSIDFDDNVTIDPSWKCPITTATNTRNSNSLKTNYFKRSFRRSYVLDSGCLREFEHFYHLFSKRLCITNSINEDLSSYSTSIYPTYTPNFNIMAAMCGQHWVDINNHCYRISDDRKTIREARNSCINVSTAETDIMSNDDDDDDDDMKKEVKNEIKNSMANIHKGEIARYTSQWQARLGFFLLDTNPSNTKSNLQPSGPYTRSSSVLLSNVNINLSLIDEFQMINSNEDNNSSIPDDSCLVLIRTVIDEKGSSILKNTQINNCSKLRHVLCKEESMLGFNSVQNCYSKPLTLGLPVMISNHLTYELCSSVCQILETDLAVINMNKCYCFDVTLLHIFDMKGNHAKYQRKDCGNPCPGNQHERCGNIDTIVVLHIRVFQHPPRYNLNNKQAKSYPDFFYHSCIHLNSVNQSAIYQFNLNRIKDIHPRHCLELCTKYNQQYALLNSNKCLCTNIPMKKQQNNIFTIQDYNCTQECQSNYFYTCGDANNSDIYSMYVMPTKCPHTFQITEDKRRCVHTDFSARKNSFSSAQSYCKSVGGMLAKINDILEIQDIVPIRMLIRSHFNEFPFSDVSNVLNDTRYFWIDRTSNIINNNETPDRSIRKCSQTSKSIDEYCIVLHRKKFLIDNMLTYEQCFIESDQCSSISATPVCVDKHLEFNSTAILPTTDDDSSVVSVNISTGYSCGDDTDYHFMNGLCYKVSFHETTWNEAKTECERENAILFLPEHLTTLLLIKSLVLRRHSYTSSGVAHLDIFYDNRNRTIRRCSTINGSSLPSVLDFNNFHTLCGKTFDQHYERFMSSSALSPNDEDRLKTQQISCAYVNFSSDSTPSISYDQKTCNRPATVICQKSPTVKIRAVAAKRLVINTNACIV
ncbi:unnamed protein product [Rotaria sordida]|uniref:WSC domain-containing protein n=2 Tax=Rotaria sordida TaxID=392033 RepID=A0A819M3I7_9BILA|nr:unnamed protein product [Rotaria sordida]